jgi:hypothetical protein
MGRFPGQTFKSRAWWMTVLFLGVPLVMVLLALLVPACHRWFGTGQ